MCYEKFNFYENHFKFTKKGDGGYELYVIPEISKPEKENEVVEIIKDVSTFTLKGACVLAVGVVFVAGFSAIMSMFRDGTDKEFVKWVSKH